MRCVLLRCDLSRAHCGPRVRQRVPADHVGARLLVGVQTEEGYRLELERDLSLFGPRGQALQAVRSRMLVDEQEAEQWLDYFRWSGSPGAVEALALMNKEIDVRHVLPVIRVPTLVIHRPGDQVVPPGVARYMAERIPGASRIELPGIGHLATGQAAAAQTSEIERFLTGVWESGGWEEVEPDRVLATVLFTDIVGSSELAVSLGDRAWGELLERHHELVRRQLARFRGKEVDTVGDGFFASFDGPCRASAVRAVLDSVQQLGIEVRAGLHTGECELVDGKVAGIAVHIGARVASQAQSGEVLVSSTVKDLVAAPSRTPVRRPWHTRAQRYSWGLAPLRCDALINPHWHLGSKRIVPGNSGGRSPCCASVRHRRPSESEVQAAGLIAVSTPLVHVTLTRSPKE